MDDFFFRTGQTRPSVTAIQAAFSGKIFSRATFSSEGYKLAIFSSAEWAKEKSGLVDGLHA
ncbi:hypothetical protein [Aquabacterium sp. NJ1]|uniref:hypothetical protein n=1 Tax=Aquabacterium sp. NJ1 TaxID=1538295 RepID=UPI001269E898|nr:hypothetical protein [Aquabacterium sp. NJ1]